MDVPQFAYPFPASKFSSRYLNPGSLVLEYVLLTFCVQNTYLPKQDIFSSNNLPFKNVSDTYKTAPELQISPRKPHRSHLIPAKTKNI